MLPNILHLPRSLQEVVTNTDRAHVFLTGAALSLQPVLGGMVSSRRHVGLTHLKPRTLFPDQPGRSARVLFAQSQAQCFIQAGSESADDGADLALCTSCVTCAAGYAGVTVAHFSGAHVACPGDRSALRAADLRARLPTWEDRGSHQTLRAVAARASRPTWRTGPATAQPEPETPA